MDLIRRKDAVFRISDLLMQQLKGQRIPTWNEVYNAIGDIPSVPAVPLDKLCEFLGKATYPCILLAIHCPYDEADCDNCDSCEAWKARLEKWMEEQYAHK